MKRMKNKVIIGLIVLLATISTLLSYFYIEDQATTYENETDALTSLQEKSMVQQILSMTFPRYYQLKKKDNPNITPYELLLPDCDFTQEENKSLAQAITNQTQAFLTDDTYEAIAYYVEDSITDTSITNRPDDIEQLKRILQDGDSQADVWFIAFSFDENGILSLNVSSDKEVDTFFTTQFWNNALYQPFLYETSLWDDHSFTFRTIDWNDFTKIKNASFVFMMDQSTKDALFKDYREGMTTYQNYYLYGELISRIYLLCAIVVITAILLLYQNGYPPLFAFFKKLTLEFHGIVLFLTFPWVLDTGGQMVFNTMRQTHPFSGEVAGEGLGNIMLWVGENGVIWLLLYTYIAYIAILLKDMYKRKAWTEYSLSARIVQLIKQKLQDLYGFIRSIDLANQNHRRILILVVINYFILAVITLTWVFGLFLLLLYSIALYVFIEKYIASVHKDYQNLLDVTKQMANGKLDQDIQVDLGVFKAFQNNMTDIRQGFQRAVEEEVHSQRMKTELITNVSHDLKTPLTNIITYIDLLKKEQISEEEQKKYLDVLDRNSIRLKHLIDDLFEISKASSGTMKLELIEVDIVALMKQIQVECEDPIKQKKLHFKNSYSDDKIICRLDSMRTYRILENLIVNITKYAMKNTRVYIDITDYNSYVDITMRNISAAEMHFDPNEITERFTRGDASRNSEGSGLGLAIAKSFTELQGGTLRIDIDGDLFKVHIRFPKHDMEETKTVS